MKDGPVFQFIRHRFVFILLLAAQLGCARHETFRDAPVILISVDTLRSDRLPAYGYRAIATPNIDALRRDSILWQRAYSQCPLTLPSHLTILTGLLPAEHGVRNNIGYRFDGSKIRTLAGTLHARGYRTGAAISAYVLRAETGISTGFDEYEDSIAANGGAAIGELRRPGAATLRSAKQWLGRNASRPLFFFFHIYEPHAPHVPSYDDQVAQSDRIVGDLVAETKRLGIYDRALIVFLSDHGEGLGEHGEDEHGIFVYRESLQVPLMIKLPHARRGGETVAFPVGLADVCPTVLSLVGAAGSTRPLFDAPHQIYSETLYPRIHLGWSELRSLIREGEHCIDGPRPELYDVAADPAEAHDRASSDRREVARFRDAMRRYPSAIAALQDIDAEDAAKLAALGYVGSARNRAGSLPNPRDVIGDLPQIKAAFQLAAARRDDDAAVALRALVTHNPRLTDGWAKLGEVLTDAGRYQEAIATYRTALAQTTPSDPELLLGLAYVYLLDGQPDQTIGGAQIAAKASPREAHELLARAYAAKHQLDEAALNVELAMAEGHHQPSTILLLAALQRDRGELNAALQTIADAERRGAEMHLAHVAGADELRGDILARLDRPDEAVAAYQREIASSPEHLQSYAHLAVIYRIEGKRAEAENTLEAMVRNNPHSGARSLAAKTRAALGL